MRRASTGKVTKRQMATRTAILHNRRVTNTHALGGDYAAQNDGMLLMTLLDELFSDYFLPFCYIALIALLGGMRNSAWAH